MKDRKLTIGVIAVLIISVIGLGIAFAAFSQTLTINGSAEVEASKWQVVFEGMTSASTIDAPTTSGTASEITRPTIKSNDTEISTYSVSLKTPGDSITYNFKIHNKGDFAANLGSLTISGVNRPSSPISGASLVTDSSIATANASTLAVIEYKFYYTDNNALVGQDPRDCLEPGESENVSLKITFSSSDATDTSILPSSDLVLDNLGVSATYNQSNNGSCPLEPGSPVVDVPFSNQDGLYYSYGGKSFIGTGVDNVIISENITSLAKYASAAAKQCSDGSTPTNYQCPSGTTPVFADSLAATAASSYCTGCRLMTLVEAAAWAGCTQSQIDNYECQNDKLIATYQDSTRRTWWFADAYDAGGAWGVYYDGRIGIDFVANSDGVRPVVSIPSGATITGSGTSDSPYVITTSN